MFCWLAAAAAGKKAPESWGQWWINEVWHQWWFQNLLTTLVVLTVAGVLWALSRREHFRLAWAQLRKRRAAMISLVVLCLYLVVGILDSYGYTFQKRDAKGELIYQKDEHGKERRDKNGLKIPVRDERGRTLLDSLFLRKIAVETAGKKGGEKKYVLGIKREKSYSPPLGRKLLIKESRVTADGKTVREYLDMKYPGEFLLGTDQNGRSVLWQSLKGIRTGLIIGLLTTLLAVPFAIFFGLSAGWFGGWVDDVIQFIYTVLGSIPSLLLIIAFMVLFGQGLPQLVLIMGLTSWVGLCRLLRGEAFKLRELEYVQASRALGAGAFSVIRRHLLPNVMHLVVITAVLRFSGLVLAEAVLSYLGVGVGGNTGSWGNMISQARNELAREPMVWWPVVSAFVMMLGLVLPANLFGDCVRDALDPRLRK